ncbi:SpoIIE family protein phosphatase [Aneurinibacillus terranovensis]|uniref:SpoIIE family protein phosphatase n=1 Tax=Aneurinibacillus terranovensis TaxID=278991 RepID=UPI000425BD61|nr:SpoIIE family protein phosphatase [Aneurinibacillus terranovensis]
MKVEKKPAIFEFSVHHTSKTPDAPSGDCYFIKQYENHMILCIADGLGSGKEALVSAEKTIKAIESHYTMDSPLDLLRVGNNTMLGARGAVAGIARIEWETECVIFAGIGNITCLSITPERKKQYLLSVPGFLNGRPFQSIERRLSYHQGDTILMYSDGIQLPDEWEYIVAKPTSTDRILKELVDKMVPIHDDATLIVGRWKN